MTTTPRRHHSRVAAVATVVLLLVTLTANIAVADTTYFPSPDNGRRIYLSEACHDRGGNQCISNDGCDGYEENLRSEKIVYDALRSQNMGLLDRQYIVQIGNGLARENVASSNEFNPVLHIPVHSNARDFNCDATNNSYGGTWPMYVSDNGRQVANQLLHSFEPASPGTNDQLVRRTDLI